MSRARFRPSAVLAASVLCSAEGLCSTGGADPSPLVTAALRTFAEIETAHGLCQAEGFQVELIRSVELALDVGITGQDLQEGGRSIASFGAQWRRVTKPNARKARPFTARNSRLNIRALSIGDSGAAAYSHKRLCGMAPRACS